MPSYARADVAFERGEGVYLYTAEGRRYLDFGAGVAVNAFGHGHPHLLDTLIRQAKKVWHTSNLYRIPEQDRLGQRLVDNSFADTVFFANSGAEAVECAMKIVRKYHDDNGNPDRYRVITFSGSFHGRTLSLISAGSNLLHKKGFEPMVDGFDQVSFGNLNEVRAAIGPKTAAILVEPVQGEGGIFPADPAFLRALRATCDEYGLLLVYDEVQSGMGRTGKLFAHEWSGAAPDVMAIAKALGGGFPVAACLATEKAAKGITYGVHGSTFGGNPLAMAVANAVLDLLLADGFLDHVVDIGKGLGRQLNELARRYPKVIDTVRGTGLIWGLKCAKPNGDLYKKLMENGLLTVLAGDNVVRILPPLIISEAHVKEAIAILDKSCREVAS
jgi:acetylornithine/N-succinyldiaminopimelate aminotransferase